MHAERENSFIGPVKRAATTTSVLVTDGSQVYAVFHVDETPFTFKELSSDWHTIVVALERSERKSEMTSLSFLSIDPRIVAIPVDTAQVALLGGKVYPIALDPNKFPEAMLVHKGGSGYGEIPFKLDASLPSYIKMDNRFFKRLMGDFTPSRGDLVFSKTGEFLGIMVSSDYCAIVNNFLSAKSLRLPDTSQQGTEKILSEMSARVRSLPFRMQ